MNNFLSNSEWLYLFIIAIMSLASISPSACYLTYGYIPEFLLAESGLYETIGAAACFIAAALNLINSKMSLTNNRKLGALWLLMVSLACLFIAGEEVSWGQHFFNYELPNSITSTNFQGELNLHNSMIIQSSNNSLSSIFFKLLMLYFIVLPMIFVLFPTFKRIARKIMVPVPSMLIAIIALFAKASDILNHKIIYGSSFKSDSLHLGEALESIFELCLLIIAVESFYFLKNNAKNLGSRY